MAQADFQDRLNRISETRGVVEPERPPTASKSPRPRQRQTAPSRMVRFLWGLLIAVAMVVVSLVGLWIVTDGLRVTSLAELESGIAGAPTIMVLLVQLPWLVHLYLGLAFWVALIRVLMGKRTYMPLILGYNFGYTVLLAVIAVWFVVETKQDTPAEWVQRAQTIFASVEASDPSF